MTEGTPKAIEPKGIVRNATKIGVQDGQAEDLINLRFVDGSWRASGNGRQIVNMPTGTIYQQIYVHTNIYHHLLGVAPDPNNGDAPTLWWFAEIADDGVTFYPLDNTTDRSLWPEDKQGLPTERKALTTVVGDVWITQTGHLLTVIDGADDFEHFVFKTGEDKYIEVNMDVNGKQTDRSLYPFGQVHFNLITGESDDYLYSEEDNTQYIDNNGDEGIDFDRSTSCIPKSDESTTHAAAQFWHSQMLSVFHKATEANRFTAPFLVIFVIKLYDGSYVYATQPVLLNPHEKIVADYLDYANQRNGLCPDLDNYVNINGYLYYRIKNYNGHSVISEDHVSNMVNRYVYPIFTSGVATGNTMPPSTIDRKNYAKSTVSVSDIALSIENINFLLQNKEVFSGVSIFVTQQSFLYDMSENGYKDGSVRYSSDVYSHPGDSRHGSGGIVISNASYYPKQRENKEIVFDLLHSPFYLLREYSNGELSNLQSEIKIDLSDPQYKGVLLNITAQKQLDYEALSRTTYLPKVSYMYNGRLHIADYKTHPFFGYPIDLFHLHNHSVKVQDGSWFKGVLPNLADNNDEYLQYPKTPIDVQDAETLGDGSALIDAEAPYFLVKVYIDTAQGEQIVTRYIPAYDPSTPVNGRADFIESLNPLITYPDARAKKIRIYYIHYYHDQDVEQEAFGRMILEKEGYHLRYEEFELKPHPYLNIAYYIDSELKPIRLEAFKLYPARRQPETQEGTEYVWVYPGLTLEEVQALANMQNTEEYFPNGLKVSKTDQPMFFPVENTYQVGSAQILALMSNTIAVGTGQTGDAPLYVFCKDGVYALYVDDSGQMAYPNARILARDVCNNPRSVTPIDAGVVFTTDRGLMMIAGEQVQEIGAPAEGDVVQYWNAGSVDYSKIATASMQQIAGLPSSLCSTTDFLTYLQDKGTLNKAAIINYNHNMRELMVSNPNYPYSYVLDREGNWSRRDYTASQYVNNYPTSYRVDAQGHFYKVDDEGDENTSLEHRKEADNKIFYLSNVIKLDSIGFKQAYRFVVRGYFETTSNTRTIYLGRFMKPNNIYSSNILYNLDSAIYDNLSAGDKINILYNGSFIQTLDVIGKDTGPNRIVLSGTILGNNGYSYSIYKVGAVVDNAIACVVEGSYDGRKFKPLGYNRKSGKFRDIGCLVSHTDMRFFRVCLSGQVTGKTRIDYMEMSAGASMLNTKIR